MLSCCVCFSPLVGPVSRFGELQTSSASTLLVVQRRKTSKRLLPTAVRLLPSGEAALRNPESVQEFGSRARIMWLEARQGSLEIRACLLERGHFERCISG